MEKSKELKPKVVIQIFNTIKGDRGFQNRPIIIWPDRLESTTAKIENQYIHFGSDLE